MLQRYFTYYDQEKAQLVHVKLTTPKTIETAKLDENEKSTEEASAEKYLPTAA